MTDRAQRVAGSIRLLTVVAEVLAIVHCKLASAGSSVVEPELNPVMPLHQGTSFLPRC